MSRTFTDVWKEAAALSDEDRATLAGLLIDPPEGELDLGVEAAWAAEIEKRVAELDAASSRSRIRNSGLAIGRRDDAVQHGDSADSADDRGALRLKPHVRRRTHHTSTALR